MLGSKCWRLYLLTLHRERKYFVLYQMIKHKYFVFHQFYQKIFIRWDSTDDEPKLPFTLASGRGGGCTPPPKSLSEMPLSRRADSADFFHGFWGI